MSTPYIGEIRLFAGNYAPLGWEFCWGQLVPIYENEALFTLIGTTYGGDGQGTFALPDLRGRVPVHQGQGPGGSNRVIGEVAGSETVTLTSAQMAAHRHTPLATSATATATSGPAGGVLANASIKVYGSGAPSKYLHGLAVTVGTTQPHENMAPFQTVNYIISMYGIFPSQG
jgi:microcystin-dependent protein